MNSKRLLTSTEFLAAQSIYISKETVAAMAVTDRYDLMKDLAGNAFHGGVCDLTSGQHVSSLLACHLILDKHELSTVLTKPIKPQR